jgi:NAD(P)-dependent dehydrogenase (short-subunit alcohol dehydrogenase family)
MRWHRPAAPSFAPPPPSGALPPCSTVLIAATRSRRHAAVAAQPCKPQEETNERRTQISDIVEAILYLEGAAFVTGEILHVDGGSAGRH